jgi:hypothetical protein
VLVVVGRAGERRVKRDQLLNTCLLGALVVATDIPLHDMSFEVHMLNCN